MAYRDVLAAATLLQAYFRRCLVRQQLPRLHCAAASIQRRWRMQLDQVAARETALLMLQTSKAVLIQSRYRSCFARDQLQMLSQAATKIQSAWHIFYLRGIFVKTRKAAITVQSLFRGWFVRQQYRAFNKAASTIRTWWQRELRLKNEENLRQSSATLIQAMWRSGLASDLASKVRASTRIQSWWRGLSHRLDYSRACRGATLLQGVLRGSLVRKDARSLQFAVATIQVQWRKHQSVSKATVDILCLQTMSGTLISLITMLYLVGQLTLQIFCVQNGAALKIQNAWRALRDRKIYSAARLAAATTVIQEWFRSAVANRNLNSSELSSEEIVAWIKEQRSQKMNDAATKIQATYAAWKMQQLLSMHAAATKIQIAYIAWKIDQLLSKLMSAVEILYRSIYGTLSRQTSVYALLQINFALRSSVVSLGKRVEAFSVPCTASFKAWEGLKFSARQYAVIIIQCFVRGCLCRQSLPAQRIARRTLFHTTPFVKQTGQSSPTDTRRSCAAIADRENGTIGGVLGDSLLKVRFAGEDAVGMVVQTAETMAERHVGHLLGRRMADGIEYEGPFNAPCLLRLALRTKAAQAVSCIFPRDATYAEHATTLK